MNKKHVSLFVLLSFISCSHENNHATYKIGTFPELEKFNMLNESELEWDKNGEENHISTVKRMESGKAFLKTVSAKERQKSILTENILYTRYRDNRCRFNLYSYKNDSLAEKIIFDSKSKTICYLDTNSTIEILMHHGIFGGYALSLKINPKSFSSNYEEDAGEENIFKTNPKDSVLTTSINIKNEEQSLTLLDSPKFQHDELLVGKLNFKTENYYKVSDFDNLLSQEYSAKSAVDRMYMKGSVIFTCQVKDLRLLEE